MRILIVSQYYYPEQFQINELAPELVLRGHKVTVLTGQPNYPKGEIYEGYEDRLSEIIDGVQVIRTRIHPRKQGAIHLLWNYLSFAINGSIKAYRIKDDYDIVFAYQLSPVTSILPAIIYKSKHKIPLLTYCLDIWPASVEGHVKSKKSIFYRCISILSKKLYQQSDHIAVTSRPFINYLSKKHGIEKNRMSYLPQHSDASYVTMDLSTTDNDIVDFMYAGNLGRGQRIDVIIRAAAEIDCDYFRIHILGDGSMKKELENLVKDLKVEEKVLFYGNKKRDELPYYYREADAFLLTLRGDNFVGNTMPGKLQTYMACGKPVFGAINGAAKEVIMSARCGACVPAEDYKGLARLMKDYIQNPMDYVSCGANGRKYFSENFTLKRFCDDLEKLTEKMT